MKKGEKKMRRNSTQKRNMCLRWWFQRKKSSLEMNFFFLQIFSWSDEKLCSIMIVVGAGQGN